MSYYFGNLSNDQSSTFGLAADMADALGDGSTNNTFALVRTESGNVNTFYVVADGAVTPCYVAKGTTRARNWLVGVVKVGENYYMTVDGTAVTGEGYSAAVQEALKLNNHFSREFLERNGSVHFYVKSKSMNAGASLRPTVKVENNLILNTQNRYSDRNGAGAIAEYNIPAATGLTATEDGNVYTFQVPSAGAGDGNFFSGEKAVRYVIGECHRSQCHWYHADSCHLFICLWRQAAGVRAEYRSGFSGSHFGDVDCGRSHHPS